MRGTPHSYHPARSILESEPQEQVEGNGKQGSCGSLYVREGSVEATAGVSATEDRETSGGSSLPEGVRTGTKRDDGRPPGKKGITLMKALHGEVDIFGQFLLYQPVDLVQCKRCGRSIVAGNSQLRFIDRVHVMIATSHPKSVIYGGFEDLQCTFLAAWVLDGAVETHDMQEQPMEAQSGTNDVTLILAIPK